MSDKTVKIEYQFTGEDKGLTTKIDEIYKKLDKLGDGASVTIKKLDGLNKKSQTLTNNLSGNASGMSVFSKEMKEIQRDLVNTTKEISKLNTAISKQKALLNSTGNNNQKELLNLTKQNEKAMNRLNSLQQKMKTNALEFKGTPKFTALEQGVKSAQKQLKGLSVPIEKLQAKKLTADVGKYQKVDVVKAKGSKADTTKIDKEVKSQKALNNAKQETLRIEQKTNKESKSNSQNESRNRNYSKNRVKNLPKTLNNISQQYKKQSLAIKDADLKLQSYNNSLENRIGKGAVNPDEFNKIEQQLNSHNKRILNATGNIQKANEKAVEALTLGKQELNRYKDTKLASGSQSYRVKQGQTINGREGSIGSLKTAMSGVQTEMNNLNSDLTSLQKNYATSSANTLKFKNNMGSLSNGTQLVGKGIDQAGQGIQKFGNNLAGVGRDIQSVSNSLRGLSVIAGGALTYAGKQGIEFNRSLMGVASTLNRMEIDDVTGKVTIMPDVEFDGVIQNIADKAREQARTSIYDANQVMEGYRYTALAGWSESEMTASMDTFINLATVARIEGENFADVVDLITDSMASLGLAYEGIDIDGDGIFDEKIRKDADSLAQEAQRLSDIMVKAQSISNMDVTQLAEGYKLAGSQLSNFGLEAEEVTSLFAVLANRGIKSSKAAAGLSSIFQNLTAKTGQSANALKEITEISGIDVSAFDKNGAYIGIDKQLDNLSKAFKKIKEKYGEEFNIDTLQLSQALGGKHHMKTLSKLLEGYQTGEYKQVLGLLKNSDGATAEMAEITNQSTWAQLKMAVSEVKEAMLSMWDAIEPSFRSLLEVVKEVAQAFGSLSKEQMASVAKMAGFIVVGTALLTIFGGLITLIGNVVKAFGSLTSVAGKSIGALGTAFSVFSGNNAMLSFFTSMSPALNNLSKGLTSFKSLITSVATSVGGFAKLGGLIASIGIFAKSVSLVGTAFKDALKDAKGLFDFIGKFGVNAGKQLEHSMLSGFKKVYKAFGGKTFFGKDINSFTSQLDEDAIKEGYTSYDDKKKGEKRAKRLERITTLFDAEKTGAFSAVINKLEELQNGNEVSFTVSDLKTDSASFRNLNKSIEEDKSKKLKLEADIEIGEDKVVKLNKQIEAVKKQIENAKKSGSSTDGFEKELSALTEKRDAEYEILVTNKEDFQSLVEQLTEKEEKVITIKEVYEENGLGKELEYEEKREQFEKKHNTKLSFVDYEGDKQKVEQLGKQIPQMVQGLQQKLETYDLSTTEGQAGYNDTYFAIQKLQEMEATIPVYLELIDNQNVLAETDKIMEASTKTIEEQKSQQKKIVEKSGLTAEELAGADKKAYENATKIIEEAQKNYEEAKKKQETAKEEITNLGDLGDVNSFWNNLYSNYDQPLIKLFDDKEVALLTEIGNLQTNNNLNKKSGEYNQKQDKINKKYAEKHAETVATANIPGATISTSFLKQNQDKEIETLQGSIVEKSKGGVVKALEWLYDNTVKNNKKTNKKAKKESKETKKETKPAENKTTENKETKTTEKATESTTKNTSATQNNSSAVKQNTQTVNENKKAVKEQQQAVEEANKTTKTDLTKSQLLPDNTVQQVEEAKEKIGAIQGSAVELTETLNNIEFGGGATEELENQLTALSEGVEKVKESLSNMFTDFDTSTLTTLGETLLEQIEQAKTAMTSIFTELDTSALTTLSETLLQQIEQAKIAISTMFTEIDTSGITIIGETLLQQINAVKETVSTLFSSIDVSPITNIGTTLQSTLQGASAIVSSMVGMIAGPGVSAMASMGNSLRTSIAGAQGALNSIIGTARGAGVGAMSAMGNALTSALAGAQGMVSGIAGQINAIKRAASEIKVPSVGMASYNLATASLNTTAMASAARTITNNNTSNSTVSNTSNFNVNMRGVTGSSRADMRTTARQLATYCKRKGL